MRLVGASSMACSAVHSPVNPPPTMTRSASSWPRSAGSGAGRSVVSSQNGVVEALFSAPVMLRDPMGPYTSSFLPLS